MTCVAILVTSCHCKVAFFFFFKSRVCLVVINVIVFLSSEKVVFDHSCLFFNVSVGGQDLDSAYSIILLVCVVLKISL